MLGDSIRQARIESGMSQEQLAERLGVSRQSISLWETNQTRPTAENIVSIAKILGVSTDDLLLDENKIWSKSSYRVTEEPDGEQKVKSSVQKKYIATAVVFAALILLSGIGIGFLMGRDTGRENVSPTETQSETKKDKESTSKKNKDVSESDTDEGDSEEKVNHTNGQTSDNNYNASTQSNTQSKDNKEETTEKQTTKKDSSTEKTTKATTTAKKELTADEVAEIINNATRKITDDCVGYSFTRTCQLTEEPVIPSKDALNKIINGVSEGKNVNDVIEEILDTGTGSESVLGGLTPSNPKYTLKPTTIKGDDITSFGVSGNTYILNIRNSTNPIRTGNVPLSRLTNYFITQEEINSFISSKIKGVSVTDYTSENTDIKVIAKIDGEKLNELIISYKTACPFTLKALVLNINCKLKYNTSIRYYDFLF